MDLTIADRGQRDDRHVEGVKERPSLDETKSEGADEGGREEHGHDRQESPFEDFSGAIEAAHAEA
jgi:hypothetical protein